MPSSISIGALEVRHATECPLHGAAKEILDGGVRCTSGSSISAAGTFQTRRASAAIEGLFSQDGTRSGVERAGEEPLAVRYITLDVRATSSQEDADGSLHRLRWYGERREAGARWPARADGASALRSERPVGRSGEFHTGAESCARSAAEKGTRT